MGTIQRAISAVIVSALVIAGPIAGSSMVGKSGHGGRTSSNSVLDLVLLDSSDGLPHYGQHVTFSVTTSDTTRPFVQLSCFQGADLVFSKSAGFFPDYTMTQTYELASSYWTGGGADCTATLYYFMTTGHEKVLSTLEFPVAA